MKTRRRVKKLSSPISRVSHSPSVDNALTRRRDPVGVSAKIADPT